MGCAGRARAEASAARREKERLAAGGGRRSRDSRGGWREARKTVRGTSAPRRLRAGRTENIWRAWHNTTKRSEVLGFSSRFEMVCLCPHSHPPVCPLTQMGNTVQNGCSWRDIGSCDGLVGRPDGDDDDGDSPVFGQRVSGLSRSNRASVRRLSSSSLFSRDGNSPPRRLTTPALSFIFASEEDMLSLPSPTKPRTPS